MDDLHRLRNDGDDGCSACVVRQRSNVSDDGHGEPFLSGAPIERVIVGVERLRDQDETVCAFLQTCRIIRVVTWVNNIAFQSISISVYLNCPGGSFFARRR